MALEKFELLFQDNFQLQKAFGPEAAIRWSVIFGTLHSLVQSNPGWKQEH